MVRKIKWKYAFAVCILFFVCFCGTCLEARAEDEKTIIILDSYQVVDQRLVSGQSNTLRLKLKNVSTVQQAEGLTISFSASSYITPGYGKSNQIYIGNLKKGEEIEVDFPIKVGNTGDVESVTVGLTISYMIPNQIASETNTTLEYTNPVYITLPISNASDINVNQIQVSENPVVNSNCLISAKYANSGKRRIQNIQMEIEGNIEDGKKVVDIGNIYANGIYYIDTTIRFIEAGEQAVNVTFFFEDAEGNAYSTTPQRIAVNVLDSTEFVFKPQEESGLDKNELIFAIALFSVSSIMLLCGWWNTRRKKRRYGG